MSVEQTISELSLFSKYKSTDCLRVKCRDGVLAWVHPYRPENKTSYPHLIVRDDGLDNYLATSGKWGRSTQSKCDVIEILFVIQLPV